MFVIVSFGFYVVWQNVANITEPAPVVAVIPTPKKVIKHVVTLPTSTPVNSTPTPIAYVPTPTPVVTPTKSTGIYKDGTYTGSVADAYYGNVQVQVTISGGRMTSIQFLDYPQDRSTSIRINSRAMPILIQEALSAQSAKVNGVSGASATSPAFVESLTYALNQAKA